MIDSLILILLAGLYAAAFVLSLLKMGQTAALIPAAAAVHGLYLVYRTVLTGHAPFSGAFESMTFFSFLLGAKLCLSLSKEGVYAVLRVCTLGLILLFVCSALLLPGSYRVGEPLVPALKSVFFIIHVPVFFLGYVSLAFAFILALTALIRRSRGDEALEAAILSEARLGYLLITAGLITGAVWAFICWGRFWGWDSKETSALATWMLYTFALHSRSVNRAHYRLALVLGFVLVLFTYLGVMFLLPGIHSYR